MILNEFALMVLTTKENNKPFTLKINLKTPTMTSITKSISTEFTAVFWTDQRAQSGLIHCLRASTAGQAAS